MAKVLIDNATISSVQRALGKAPLKDPALLDIEHVALARFCEAVLLNDGVVVPDNYKAELTASRKAFITGEAFRSILRYRARKPINWPLALALLLSLGLLGSTAWRGGELVFRHGLGVMSLPHVGNHQHAAGEVPDEHPAPTAGTTSPAGQVNETVPHEHSEDTPHTH